MYTDGFQLIYLDASLMFPTLLHVFRYSSNAVN